MGFSTDAIHAGQKPDLETGAVITPIYLTSTYTQIELGKHKGFAYGRTHNLTRSTLEQNIATLEKGKFGVAFASGLAAINSLMSLVKAGDHIIVGDNVYGGTYRLFELVMKNYDLEFSWIDTSNFKNVEEALKPNTKMLYVESPSNPMLTLTDLEAVSKFCKQNNLISVVDNTFMTPYFQNPLLFDIDLVVHSSTKYLNGHSDVLGGIVITNNENYYNRLKFIQNAAGAIPSPFDCWLILRSTKTLAVRMERHNYNALKIAEYLNSLKTIKKVYYPGLGNHPQYFLAKNQMRGYGGIVSIDLGDFELAKRFVDNLKIFTLAESLGGVESLVCHPATMTHSSVPKEKRDEFGLTDGLIRLSIGIEDLEDLIDDIRNSL